MNITADSARDKAYSYLLEDLEGILEKIELAASNGEFKLYYYEHINTPTEQELVSRGFKIATSCHRNELLVTITW